MWIYTNEWRAVKSVTTMAIIKTSSYYLILIFLNCSKQKQWCIIESITPREKISDNNIETWKQEGEVYFYKVLVLHMKWYNGLEDG